MFQPLPHMGALFGEVAVPLEYWGLTGRCGPLGVGLRVLSLPPTFGSTLGFLMHKDVKNFYAHSHHHEATLPCFFSTRRD